MPNTNKLVSLLRNAFSYAVHFESADDRSRKAEVSEKLLQLSPLEDAGAKDRLQATLLKTRTKALDALLEKKVAITLDGRLARQKFNTKAAREPGKGIAHPADVVAISGAFYPSSEGGTVALWDSGKVDKTAQARNVTLLKELAGILKEGTPDKTIYGYTIITATGGEGGMAILPSTLWDTKMVDSPANLTGSKELETPPAKPAAMKPAA